VEGLGEEVAREGEGAYRVVHVGVWVGRLRGCCLEKMRDGHGWKSEVRWWLPVLKEKLRLRARGVWRRMRGWLLWQHLAGSMLIYNYKF
jgi:hypothetical protein